MSYTKSGCARSTFGSAASAAALTMAPMPSWISKIASAAPASGSGVTSTTDRPLASATACAVVSITAGAATAIVASTRRGTKTGVGCDADEGRSGWSMQGHGGGVTSVSIVKAPGARASTRRSTGRFTSGGSSIS